MYIVVSNNAQNIPPSLKNSIVEVWDFDEFITKANIGLDIDEGLYYDVDCLIPEVYDAILQFINSHNFKFYSFSKFIPDYMDKSLVELYEIPNDNIVEQSSNENQTNEQPPIVEPTPEPTPIIEEEQPPIIEPTPEPTPIIEEEQPPIIEPTPEPIIEPIESIIEPTPEPIYNTPNNTNTSSIGNDLKVATEEVNNVNNDNLKAKSLSNLLLYDDYDAGDKLNNSPAKVILFGSSKGGTGKTFTCLMSAYWYAKNHPNEKIALADFDIIDGQIGITINKIFPTLQNYYKLYVNDKKDYQYLSNCIVKSDKFSQNIDFFLPPSQDIPEITNNNEFWTKVFELLITNYDVVFFDSGIDYLGKEPISRLYKIADKIIITCNPSINSVKSVIKQFKTLKGDRLNNIFSSEDNILDRVNVVLTRVYDNNNINDIVVENITKYAPIIAAFGNIDSIVSQVQWYQSWNLIDENNAITQYLDIITTLEEDNDE